LSEYLEEIPEKYHNRIVIHTHHKLAMNYPLKGYSLDQAPPQKRGKTYFSTHFLPNQKTSSP
jgi:hypothetical protein